MQWARRAYCLDSRALRRSQGKKTSSHGAAFDCWLHSQKLAWKPKQNFGRSNSCAKGWCSASVINYQGWTSGLKVTSQKHTGAHLSCTNIFFQKILMEDFECLWRMYIDCIMYIVKEIKLAATGIQYTSYLHHFCYGVSCNYRCHCWFCHVRIDLLNAVKEDVRDHHQTYASRIDTWWNGSGDRWQNIHQDRWSIHVCLKSSDFQCFGSVLVFHLGEWVRPALIGFSTSTKL